MKFKCINLAIAFLLCIGFIETANSQNVKTKPVPKTKEQRSVNTKETGKTKKESEGWEKSWYAIARVSGTFDSNFGHDPVGTRSYGVIPGFDFGYQMRSSRQRLKFNYSIGVPRYTKFEKYNRIGQYFAGAYRFDFGKGWSTESEAEALLKGTGEDRELNNQYIFTQNLAYRFARKNKITAYAAYRLKRESEEADQNAENPQYGLKFSRQLTKKLEWQAGFRYDENLARGERQRYVRRTFDTEFNYEPTTRDKITFEASYAPRLYARTVEVGNFEVPRKDKKWSFDLGWRRDLTSRFGFDANYNFEKRDSNDADKIYRAHQVVFAFYYRWGNSKEF